MLKLALTCLLVALIAGAFGFTGIAGAAAGIAKVLFGLFLALCLVFFLIGMFVAKKVL